MERWTQPGHETRPPPACRRPHPGAWETRIPCPIQDTNSLTFKLVSLRPGPWQDHRQSAAPLIDIPSPGTQGEVMTMETKDDRTLFDLLPLGFLRPSGC